MSGYLIANSMMKQTQELFRSMSETSACYSLILDLAVCLSHPHEGYVLAGGGGGGGGGGVKNVCFVYLAF